MGEMATDNVAARNGARRVKPAWFERARKKWSREMAQVHLRAISPASENDRLQVALDGWRLRAQALALVLIERASR